MCTVSWHHVDGGFELYFNRDERHERSPGTPPRIGASRDVSYLAPLDGDHGGSWLAANERGLCVCLVNGPANPRHDADSAGCLSRGAIPLALIDAANAAGAAGRVEALDLRRFRPFVVFLLDRDGDRLTAAWDGTRLECGERPDPARPLVSSSFASADVRAHRVRVFERMVARGGSDGAPARHLAFHASHEPEAGPYSTCMHRDDARTVSFTRVRVASPRVELTYAPDSPCRGIPTEPTATLALVP